MSDSTRPVRVRFAPSPTGKLHIGGARTAIYNWAFARHQGGSFILRIEDTDPERSSVENTEQIIRSLRWLGLNWDEGPEAGSGANSTRSAGAAGANSGAAGNTSGGASATDASGGAATDADGGAATPGCGPYLQSQRFGLYREQLERLVASGNVYPCFCSPEELDAKRRQAQIQQRNYGYDRRCRALPAAEAAARVQAGEAHTWRLKIPLERGPVVFSDLVYGEISIPIEQLDDFILYRSDGTPTYNFVVCVDDALMGITHVIRGDDHLSNTPKQILVYEALAQPIPQFAHLSMILGGDGKRLSKRHGATSVELYRDAGYLPEALLNYLSLLGWSLDGTSTIIPAAELVANFSLRRISRNPAVFDNQKLDWLNQTYIKQMGAAAFIDAVLPWLEAAGLTDAARLAAARDWHEAIYPLVAERVHTLAEVPALVTYLFSGASVALEEKSVEKCLYADGAASALARATELLSDTKLDWSHEAIEAALRGGAAALEMKPKLFFQAIRVAVCGAMVSPPLFESIALVGRENTLARLLAATQLILRNSEATTRA
ncbi:MAG: glutamate--tRNA ligase [Coriobacteriales bacterium]|jgi:glutamyl-tRNA synthetase|nr:glutamate--tRNA ligase [Coriobacteriales bacterium]